MTPLRLAIDVGPLYGHRTGVGVAAAGMQRALSERTDVMLEPYLVSFRARPGHGHRKLPLPGIAASHLWSRSDHPWADRWLAGCDVVHGTNYVAPPSRLPTVVSVYDCWFLRHPDLASPVVRRAGRTLRRAVDRGAWIHASSNATAEAAAELLATDRVTTVPLGPPPAVPDPAELPTPEVANWIGRRPFVLAIGTEERRKDLPALVGAVAASSRGDALLVLAGARGDQSTELDAAIADQPGDVVRRIIRLGPIDQTTKHWLLRHAAVLAYPSIDEGFGFPILEAQMAGTPVVARAVGSIPEVAGDGAELASDLSAEAFIAALDRVLTDAETRRRVLDAGNRNLLRFDWTETASGLVRMYTRAKETA